MKHGTFTVQYDHSTLWHDVQTDCFIFSESNCDGVMFERAIWKGVKHIMSVKAYYFQCLATGFAPKFFIKKRAIFFYYVHQIGKIASLVHYWYSRWNQKPLSGKRYYIKRMSGIMEQNTVWNGVRGPKSRPEHLYQLYRSVSSPPTPTGYSDRFVLLSVDPYQVLYTSRFYQN